MWRPRLGGDGGACIDTDGNDKCAAATTEESCENTRIAGRSATGQPEYFEPMHFAPLGRWDASPVWMAADMTISGTSVIHTEKKVATARLQDFNCHELSTIDARACWVEHVAW